MAEFSHTIFYVKDIAHIIAFYEKAFGIKPRFVHESGAYAELQTGNTTLAFADDTLKRENFPEEILLPSEQEHSCMAFEIVFTVSDVHSAYDNAIAAGAVACVPPKQKPWGQIVAYVKDPNGFLIEIASAMVAP